MNLIDSDNFPQCNTIATIGFFDGVHRGHSFLLQELNSLAKKDGLQSLVISFFSPPQKTLNPLSDVCLLSTSREKTAQFEALELDNCLLLNFDNVLAQKTALEFLCFIKSEFRVQKLLMGYDHRFGSDKILNFEEYKKIGEKVGVEILKCSPFLFENNEISSSKIRLLIKEGEIEKANFLLGYAYSLTGEVVLGNQIGRKIGFPTANLSVDSNKLLPKNGVYAVDVIVEGRQFKGLLNIGTRPTLNADGKTIEVHILDFNEEIYKKTIFVKIKRRLRDEQKFASLEELKAQIAKDKSNLE